jgi:hypothetical protein
MTITSTEERSARQFGQPEQIAPAAAAPAGLGPAPPSTSVARSGGISVEAEEPEPVRAGTDWMTRFAWAKTVGGW